MDEKLREMGLAEFRENGAKDNGISFTKGILGGYNAKEVDDYIKVLKDRLAGAENTFRDRLDEFSVMTSMLTQERDKYKALCERTAEEVKAVKSSLTVMEDENTSLKQTVTQLEERALSEVELEGLRRMSARNAVLEKMAEEHDVLLAERITLGKQLEAIESELDARGTQLKALSEMDTEKTQRLAVLNAQIESLKKRGEHLEAMERSSEEQKRKLERYEASETEKLQRINGLSVDNERLKKQCGELESKNRQLTKSVELLQQAEDRLSDRLNEYMMNEIDKNEYNALIQESKQIRAQKDELATQKNILLSEKKLLAEENTRLSEQVSRLNKRNLELYEEQGRTRIQTNTLVSDIKSRTYEYSQNHKRNYEMLSESIRLIAGLIDVENEDITRLCAFQSTISANGEDPADGEL
ncbi:MAG: hypothetical protein AB9835_03740 [Eubacteriales bacterium]